MMNHDVINPPLSILQRLDHLERQMLFLEERQRFTAPNSSVVVEKCLIPEEEEDEEEEQCKSMFSALEEVHHKGTLMERLAVLENRLIQLSIDVDLENTSRSSYSNSVVAEKLPEKQGPLATQGKDIIVVEACSLNSPSCRAHIRRVKVMSRMGYYRKWLKWLKLGC